MILWVWLVPGFLYFVFWSCFRFSRTKGLFAAMLPSVGQFSIWEQSAQVSNPFSRTQLCIGQSLSQKGVFAPSIRQPVQLIISGVMVTPLSFVHRAAVFSRRALSFVKVFRFDDHARIDTTFGIAFMDIAMEAALTVLFTSAPRIPHGHRFTLLSFIPQHKLISISIFQGLCPY